MFYNPVTQVTCHTHLHSLQPELNTNLFVLIILRCKKYAMIGKEEIGGGINSIYRKLATYFLNKEKCPQIQPRG